MEYRTLGRTGLRVSRLGMGLFQIGKLPLDSVPQVSRLLGAALEKGINFLDTAAGYDNSEELIGKAVSDRRDEFVLATKCGSFSALEPWTAETVTRHIDRSLRRLRTDRLDL
ncbi:MAG: aldo/keto reductase, partial [Betaproteobacteria bacterium]|nr:aldo/keto reductase [Betaproteobacteria bacterium]